MIKAGLLYADNTPVEQARTACERERESVRVCVHARARTCMCASA